MRSGLAMRVMIAKQVELLPTPLGRAEVNSGLNGMQAILSVVTPLGWGQLCRMCARSTQKNGIWKQPGGHFILAALIRFLSRQLVMNGHLVAQ